MVSTRLAITIIVTLALFFLIFESKAVSNSHVEGVGTAAFASQKVDLSVYYESLCHSCATFIIKNLGEIFNNGLFNIINLQLLPWANSHIGNASNSIICQNGSDEWQLNSLQTCVLNVWDDVNKHYALISCLEFLAIEGRQKSWKICFKQLGLPEKPILDCYNNGNGTELGRKYISKTAQLYPPHDFLPWVLVNNQPIGKDYANFRTYVCRAYKGTAAPAACNSPWEKENGGFLNTRSLA